MSCTYAKNQNLIKSLAVFIGLLFAICGTAHADKFNDRRVEVGLKLFRTLISADLNINTNINEQGLLRVLLIYVNDNQLALNHIKALSNDFKAVNKIPISLQAYPINQLANLKSEKIAAIFIAEELDDTERQALVRFSIQESVIVFSPYVGDVEKGVLGGISVQATVKPYLNINTLNAGNFRIKSFYSKVAKHYE